MQDLWKLFVKRLEVKVGYCVVWDCSRLGLKRNALIAELRDSGLLCREASNNNGILIKEANNEFTFLI
ncbi:hypothetical protein P8452_17137 [Trifolium repens]|nr:hypothetical protein P8452_17137 [Trifolium repens]